MSMDGKNDFNVKKARTYSSNGPRKQEPSTNRNLREQALEPYRDTILEQP